jgi:hypothetical protein
MAEVPGSQKTQRENTKQALSKKSSFWTISRQEFNSYLGIPARISKKDKYLLSKLMSVFQFYLDKYVTRYLSGKAYI